MMPVMPLELTTLDQGEENIVFLHGLGGTHRYWQAGLQGVAARCHLVDLLGFGDSPKPWRRYTLDAHLDALETTLRPLAPFRLIGHSMGATLALALAARSPELVTQLGLLSLPCFGSEEEARRWLRRVPSGWIYTNIVSAALACMITRRLAGRLLPRLLPQFPQEIAEDLVKHNFLSFVTSLWDIIYEHDPAAAAARLPDRIPVTCIHGMADTTAPILRARQLARAQPTWRFHALPGVDHHPWLAQTRACTEMLELPLMECGASPDRLGATEASDAINQQDICRGHCNGNL